MNYLTGNGVNGLITDIFTYNKKLIIIIFSTCYADFNLIKVIFLKHQSPLGVDSNKI